MNIDQWNQDLRSAWRGLSRVPGLAGAAILTLTLGTAGTTIMFALVEGVTLRPLPIPDQDRVVVAWSELRSTGAAHWPFEVPHFDVIAAETRVLEAVAGVGYPGAGPMVAVENGSSSHIRGASVTGGFFEVLRVQPILGRTLTRADDVAGAEPVLVITHRLWQRRYGGAADVIGRKVTILERPFAIVGVMPPDVEYPQGVEAWMTVAVQTALLTNPNFRVDVDLMARLRQGATIAQAAAELRTISLQIPTDPADGAPADLTPVVRTYEDVIVGDVRWTVLVLFGAVGLVLLIASANVANLLLLHGDARRPELAVRAALGATRARLLGYLLAESFLLSVLAGVVGLVIAWWALPMLLVWLPVDIPRADAVRIDAGVVLFTVGTALLTTTLAGMAPALSSWRADLISHLRGSGRGAVSRGSRRTRRVLVATQIALAVTVIAAAGLLTRSVLRLQAVDLGLAAERLALVELALPETRYTDRTRHLQLLADVVTQLEGSGVLDAATPINNPPFGFGWDVPRFTAEGQSDGQAARNPSLNLESVHAGYFDTLGVRIVRGRGFTAADRQDAPAVAIVSADVAARIWPGQDPIGRRLKFGGVDSSDSWLTVVGVSAPTRYRHLAELRPTLYLPAEQFIVSAHMLMVRSAAPMALVGQAVRDGVRRADPAVNVLRVTAFEDLVGEPLARPRFNALLIGLFATASLLLAAVGLYGVIAASVRQRHAEIAVRVALGARASDIRRLVLREGISVAVLGAVVGFGAAAIAARLLRSLLYEVDPLDPPAMLAAAILVAGASAAACAFPALRASRIDPMVALRTE